MENNEGKIFEVPKWEYKKIPLDTENHYKELAELGKKGWDAVGFPTVEAGGVSHRTPNLLLKRQIGTVRLMEVAKEQTPPSPRRDGGSGYNGY